MSSSALRRSARGVIERLFDLSDGEAGHLAHRRAWVTRRTSVETLSELIARLRPLSDERLPLIRLGPDGDGGYLVPDDLEGVGGCFSPGVDRVSGFELDCARRGMDVYLADRSVPGPAISHERFTFLRKHIGASSGEGFVTMDDWVAGSSVDQEADLLLQMDIEGAEFEVLLNMSEGLLRRFRIMVIEFHHLTELWSEPFFRVVAPAFEKILRGHACMHIHPNTGCRGYPRRAELDIPRTMEFTFLRRDRVHSSVYAERFPHPLDRDNTPGPPLVLPPDWRGTGTIPADKMTGT